MKLHDLDAEFIDTAPNGGLRHGPDCGQGVLFDDPQGGGYKVCVWFANPLGGKPVAGPEYDPKPRWQREGDTLETLTLSPSVNVHGGWHGWVRAGEVTG